jgi:signal transduction histidine kinase
LAADSVLAFVLTGLTLASLVVNDEALEAYELDSGPSRMWSIILSLVLVIPIAARRVRPAWSFVAVSVAFGVYRVVEVPEPTVSSVVYFIALVSAGIYLAPPSRNRLRVCSVAALVGVLFLSIATVDAPAEIDHLVVSTVAFSVAFNVVFFVVAWLLGETFRLRHEREASLVEMTARLENERESRARHAVLDERLRIARELHDVVAHHVSVMGVQAGAARRVLGRDPEAAIAALSTIESSSREGIDELRRLVGFLRADGDVDSLAPQPGLTRLCELVDDATHAGLAVRHIVEGAPRPVPGSIDVSAYRVVQEALTNTRKHANASTADVVVRYLADAVEVEIVDDGRGAATALVAPANGTGHGLVGMRERVVLHDGDLSSGPRSGGGYGVRARFPVRG